MNISIKALILVLFVFTVTDTCADTYSYVNTDGSIVFTDDSSKIPLKQRNVRKIPYGTGIAMPVNRDASTPAITANPLHKRRETPEVSRQNAFYDIGGYTFMDLRREIYRRSPRRMNKKVAVAWCQWQVTWNILTRENNSHCDIASVDTRVAVTITMPRWTNFASTGNGMKEAWNLYYASVLAHEETHANHGLAAANDIQRRLSDMGGGASCRSVLEDGDHLARSIINDYRDKDVEFDRVSGDDSDTITEVEIAADKREGVLGRQYPARRR